MGLSSYDITISQASAVTVTAVMASAPTYTVAAVRLVAQPVFKDFASINGIQYSPGDSLVSAIGGTVSTALVSTVTGATTAAASTTSITGAYYTTTKTAAFVVPFGTTYSSSASEWQSGASPREYGYTASFISSSSGVTAVAEQIIAGKVYLSLDRQIRGQSSENKAVSVSQS